MNIVISIIIPTFKRYHSLARTLQSVTKHSISESEIIVVDQSPDNKIHSLKICQKFPLVQYNCYDTPGLPQARNIGIIHSRGSILFFIDDDVVIHPSCLKVHISLHKKKEIYAVAGRIVQMNKNQRWEQMATVAKIDRQTGETKGNFDLDYEGNVLYATGGHMSIKRDVFNRVGLFNNRFIGNALYEDVEFFSRMRKRGYTVYYSSKAIIYHYPSDSGGCHESKGNQYLLERLHNQSLFYLLHIQIIPSLSFLKYCKNIMEYIARNNDKTYSVRRFALCLRMFFKAYSNALLSVITIPMPK